jgi:hypothetical protein
LRLEPLEDRCLPNVTGYDTKAVFTSNGHTYAVHATFTGEPSGPLQEAVHGTLAATITENGVGVQNYPITFRAEDGPGATILASLGPWVNNFPVVTQTLHTINNGTASIGATTTALDPLPGPLPILPNYIGPFFVDVMVPGLNGPNDALLRVPLFGVHGYVSGIAPTTLNTPINTSAAGLFRAFVGDNFGIGVQTNAPVTFQINPGPGGAGGSFAGGSLTATITTDSGGLAVAPSFTSNGIGGSYTVTAFIAGEDHAGRATYSVTNTFTTTAAPFAAVTYNTSAQSVSLTASVSDSLGRTVNGGTVTFAVSGVGSFTSGPVSNGAASVSFSLPGGTAAGSYAITTTYSGTDAFSSSSNGAGSLNVAKARPTVRVSDAGGDYNGSPFPAAATVAGVDGGAGATLEGVSLSFQYLRVNTDGSTTDLGAQPPAGAGSYRVTASFAGSADYLTASASTSFIISRAVPTVNVSDAGGAYNGSPFPAAATVTGVSGQPGAALEGVGLTLQYVRLNADGTTTDLGSQAPAVAGDYRVTASFAGSADYTPATASVNFTIARATPTFSQLSSPTIIVGTAETTLSGRLSLGALIPTGSVSIALNGGTLLAAIGSDGSFSATFATALLAPGSYGIGYSYAGDANFTGASGTGTLAVAYDTRVLFDNTRPVQRNSALPIRVGLADASGSNVSAANISVQAVSLQAADGTARNLVAKGEANPNNFFRYDPTLGGYVFNLDTSGLSSGTYTLLYRAGNDPTLHAVTFMVR